VSKNVKHIKHKIYKHERSDAEPLLQRHYRAPQVNGSARTSKETTQTPLPQLVNALGLTQSCKNASSPHVDLAVPFPRNGCHHEPSPVSMAGASVYRTLAGAAEYASVREGVPRVYGGVYRGIQGYVHGVLRCFAVLNGQNRPFPFTAPL